MLGLQRFRASGGGAARQKTSRRDIPARRPVGSRVRGDDATAASRRRRHGQLEPAILIAGHLGRVAAGLRAALRAPGRCTNTPADARRHVWFCGWESWRRSTAAERWLSHGLHVRSTPFCRVAPGDCAPGAPTDPDVRNSRIRLLKLWVRYVPCTPSERREAPEAGTLSGSHACGPTAFLDSSVAPASSAIGVAPARQGD